MEKQKNGSYNFQLRGKFYNLIFEGDSPVVFLNGVKQISRRILRDYILKENLPIEINHIKKDGSVIEKTTNQYGVSLQKYLGINSTNITKIKSEKLISIDRVKNQESSIDEYLQLCKDEISDQEYLEYEKIRVANSNKIHSFDWIEIIKRQAFKCYYCNTDIRVIQQLIINKTIKLRKRGKYGYSGLHFELDHKNAVNTDNKIENLVASCYFCNNDKSDTFSSQVFKNYFGLNKKNAFEDLFKDQKLKKTDKFHHNLKGKHEK
jgi:5-methylcytosine-specific restriction endonuclease McrA